MVSDGQQPTIRAVREALGSGSPNTVHAHLTAWRAARPQAQAQVPELPGELVLALAQEIERAAARARSEVEGRLVEAQAEAGELSAAGAALEVELAERVAEVSMLTTERDQALATAVERAEEIKRQAESLVLERQTADTARVELAKIQLRVEQQAEKAAEQASKIQGLEAELGKAQEARQAGAVELRGVQTELAAEKAAKAELAAEKDFFKQGLKDVEAELDQARTQAEEARKAHRDELSQAQVAHRAELAEAQTKAEAERKAHRDELATVRAEGAAEVARIREELAKAQGEAANVREELAEVRKAKPLLAPHKARKDGTLEG
jgi:chromosome segregation ATPase